MNVSCGLWGWLVAASCAVFLSSGPAAHADDTLEFMSLIDRLSVAEEKQNYDEAFRLGDQAVKLINGSQQLRGSEFEVVALARIGLLHFSQGNLTVAEQQMRRALEVTEKIPSSTQMLPLDQMVTPLLLAQGRIYQNSGLFTESIAVARRAVTITEKPNNDPNGFHAMCLAMLGDAYSGLGRYAEAEHYHKKAVVIGDQKPNDFHYVSLFGLANDFSQQSRHDEALALIERGLRLIEQSGRLNSLEGVTCLQRLASAYLNVSRVAEAERAAIRAFDLAEKLGPTAKSAMMEVRATLANIYLAQGQTEKGREEFRRIIQAAQSANGGSLKVVADANLQMAMLYYGEKRWTEAKACVTEAIRLQEKEQTVTAALAMSRMLLGMMEIELANNPEAGLPAFEKAFETFTRVRNSTGGDPFDVANSVAGYQFMIDLLPLSQAAAGRPAKTFELLELNRARGLLGQMKLQGLSPVAGVPKAEADRLMQREKSARIQMAELAQKISVMEFSTAKSPAERQRRIAELEAELGVARRNLVENHREMYNAGRAYRLAENSNLSSVSLTELQGYLSERKALLLHYTINSISGTVMAILPSGQPYIVALTLSDEQKRALKMNSTIKVAGDSVPVPESDVTTVTSANLQSALMTSRGDGILQQLALPEPPAELSKKLQVLADLLLPGDLKKLVQSEKIQQIIIVPDGPLSLLPFEVLVLDADKEPRYLLDAAAPISYAPSATVLWNLHQQKPAAAAKPVNPVLSLGDALYQPIASTIANQSAATELTARSRYGKTRSRLTPLPYSGTESKWITEVFTKAGLPSDRLEKQKATEAWVRSSVPGRKIVHLACHGLVDEKLGNRFGALALTPGPQAATDSLDDGYLTLAEIGDLNLRSCELAILSACESNFGPQQSGEGVWALSRGFLVAGARRVAASNWLVDDEAAASLMSYFTGGIARDMGQSASPDYSKRLRDAKRWVRQQDKWKSPYYWGGFVLVGPN